MLGFPLATALIVAGPAWASLGVALAAVAGFLAHEPLLVIRGRRGLRAQREAPAAKQWLWAYALIATTGSSLAFGLGSSAVRWSLLCCGAIATAGFALAWAGKHHSRAGQAFGAVGLSAPCVPILLSESEASIATAAEFWATWLIGLAAAMIAVNSVLAPAKRLARPTATGLLFLLGVATAILQAIGCHLPMAVIPVFGLAMTLLLYPPRPKHLKRVGWTLAGGVFATSIWLLTLC
ncbi:hypothetical protein MalM25_03870 [Planctomycetes bacterium MalM25]|nr:hypothetical protein MalM25_03870 [Planctomycetes bacterium MalM25]